MPTQPQVRIIPGDRERGAPQVEQSKRKQTHGIAKSELHNMCSLVRWLAALLPAPDQFPDQEPSDHAPKQVQCKFANTLEEYTDDLPNKLSDLCSCMISTQFHIFSSNVLIIILYYYYACACSVVPNVTHEAVRRFCQYRTQM